jgi:hypothetical protein
MMAGMLDVDRLYWNYSGHVGIGVLPAGFRLESREFQVQKMDLRLRNSRMAGIFPFHRPKFVIAAGQDSRELRFDSAQGGKGLPTVHPRHGEIGD